MSEQKKLALLEKLFILLRNTVEKNRYGKVEISFEAGNIVNVKVVENIKL